MLVLIYLVIGFVVAMINNHLYAELEPLEDKSSENPAMIIVLIGWLLFWPIGLVNTAGMCHELLRRKYEN